MQKLFSAFVLVILLLVVIGGKGQATSSAAAAPTFTRDVAPILYKNCVQCHRAGEIAPMSLLTYEEVRPWARAIRKATSEGVMPPWHADAPHGTFENERRLSPSETDIIARWVQEGAPQGDPQDMPAPPALVEGWRIGTPDAVFAMLEDYEVPATGTVEYEYFYIPTNFTEGKWLQAIEVRPGNRQLLHHVIVSYEAPPEGPRPAAALKFGPEQRLPQQKDGQRPERKAANPRRMIASYAPGTDPQFFRPETALRLAPGGTIQLQMHYTTNGKAGTDRTKIGMIFAKEPPAHELRASAFLNAKLTIPAGAREHKVDANVEMLQDVVVWGMLPHTHLRGIKWEYTIALPDGTTKPLLSVPKYDFNWQTYYMFKEPITVPKGARILSSAWYDNSERNPSNPDPKSEVKWGDQTWEEMQYTGIIYSAKTPPQTTTAQPQR
jgi:mono/diheme cytochrome c family protein